MPRDGSGNYTLPGSDFVAGTTIAAADVNAKFDDIASALTASLSKDGQTSPTANLPMANFRHTSVGDASARTQYASAGQVQDGALVWAGDTGGASSAYTATLTPGGVALVSGLTVRVRMHATCAADATLALNGLAAKDIQYMGWTTLANIRAGQLREGQIVDLTFDADLDVWIVTSAIADASTWVTVGDSVSNEAKSSVDFVVPPNTARLRFEFADCRPASDADMFMRYSRNGGSSYLSSSSDYIFGINGDTPISQGHIPLVGENVSSSFTAFGVIELQVNGAAQGFATSVSIVNDGGTRWQHSQVLFAATVGVDITNVRFGFVGVNTAAHRIRMLAQRT